MSWLGLGLEEPKCIRGLRHKLKLLEVNFKKQLYKCLVDCRSCFEWLNNKLVLINVKISSVMEMRVNKTQYLLIY